MKFIHTICFIVLPYFLMSQLQTTGGLTPNQLVQNVLVGQGVTVSNVTYSGVQSAIGRFNAQNTALPIEDGIILTTGTISSGPDGPYGPNNQPNAGMDNGAGGFGLLSNLINGTSTYNAAILEFDFIPQSDTIEFEYIFGSEEYPEWVGDQFNDVFAFFISGPGINGTQNMAIIPGTNLPVAINNVNNGSSNTGPCTNCDYYINNGNGNQPPFNQDPFYIQYDGYTTPLKAVSPVQCGETYHLIIAIADAGDAIFDSGIFLAANSLSSVQNLVVDYTLSGDPVGDGKTMLQGCSYAEVTVTRSGDISQPLAVPVNISGSAVEGLDYSSVPTVINFNANQAVRTFTIDALVNPNLTDTVNVELEFTFIDPCGEESSTSFELFIQPVEEVELELIYDEALCSGDPISIEAMISGGAGNYDVLWSTGDTSLTIFVTPDETTTYYLTVSDTCLNESVIDSATIIVPVYDELVINVTEDIEEICPFVSHDLFVEVIGGAGNNVYEWTNSAGETIGESNTVTVNPENTSTYFVQVEDQCGAELNGQVTITILSPPLEVSISPIQEICPDDSVLISASASGGFGDFYYFWPHSGETDSIIWVKPEETRDYLVIVEDDCGTFSVEATTTVIVQKPDADFAIVTSPIFNDLPITFQNLTNNGDFYEWFFGDGNFSTNVHPNNTFDEPGEYEITLIATDSKGCTDTIVKIITINEEYYIYVPNAITPNGDRHNHYFTVSTVNIVDFEIEIFNRWGELLFSSDDANFQWDATHKGRLVPDGVYVWKIVYTTRAGDEEHLNGSLTVLR